MINSITYSTTPQYITNKNLAGKTIRASLFSNKYQLVHIKIATIVNTLKLSLWTEINKGENSITMDISELTPGTYKITVDFSEENTREEIFNIA